MPKLFFKLIIGLAALSAVAAGAFVTYDYLSTREVFPPRTYISNVEVTGLTPAAAREKIGRLSLTQLYTPLITLEAGQDNYSFTPGQLGITVDYDETIKRAFELSHQPNYLNELKDRLTKGVLVSPLVLKIDEDQLKTLLAGLADTVFSTAKDATILFYENTGGYHIESEEIGRDLDVPKSADSFKRAIYEGKTSVPLIMSYLEPAVTEKLLRESPPVHRLAAYTTYYGTHDSPNRIHNIRLIASWLDDTLLLPGEKFKLAERIGDFTADRGFKEAFVILGGELVPQLGGGTCQIGTTLYNAVALADLKILQRRNHSFYFNIYPLGRDAAVYPGSVDVVFENDTGFPVLIKTVATNKRLSFRVYGTPTGKKVEFSDPAIVGLSEGRFVPMSLRRVINLDVPFKTMVVRTVYDAEGNKLKEEKIQSYYKLYGEKTNVPIRRPEPR